jgi:hypothetical protein
MIPPLFLNFSIGERGRSRFRLWLPVFLLIPFVYIVIAIVDLFLIPILLVLTPQGRRLACAKVALIEPFRILNATKGLTVEVVDSTQQILISIS